MSEGQYFINPDGLKLFTQIWYPTNQNIKAFVFILHGLSENSSFYYYDLVVKPLNDIGCLVATHDHVGHGKSEGNRRLLEKIDKLSRDVIVHINTIRKNENLLGDIPTFLYGHSMGALVATVTAYKHPNLIKGMVLESPPLSLDGKVGPWMKYLALLFSYIAPYYAMGTPDFESLAENKEIVQAAINDPTRNKDPMTLTTAVHIGEGIHYLQSSFKTIITPFFIAHGKNDIMISSKGSKKLFNECKTNDKLLIIYENAKHVVRSDSKEFQEKFVEWISQRI